MAGDEDYYSILGVDRDANKDEIKKAFNTLVKKYHPDKNPDNKKEAEKKFKKIAEAYDALSNPKKKAQYDPTKPTPAKRGRRRR